MKGYSRLHFLSPVIVVLALFCFIGSSYAATKFPLRAKYPHLKPVESRELASIYNKAIIVDSRNRMEYNVVHMEGAKNILVGRMSEGNLLALRPKKDSRSLVFYCNGTTCAKSYKAADKAVSWGFNNVLVYDPGIFAWAQDVPHRAIFFDEKLTPETVKKAFISKERFNSTLLSTADFINKSKSGKFTVIDGRDVEEIQEQPIELKGIRIMSIDLMTTLLKKKSWIMPTSDLLVLDNVGKQVKWLQYYFERNGVTNYYFLKGGVRQWIADGYDKFGSKR